MREPGTGRGSREVKRGHQATNHLSGGHPAGKPGRDSQRATAAGALQQAVIANKVPRQPRNQQLPCLSSRLINLAETMRERISYLQKLGDSLEPSAVTVNGGTISGPDVHAVREDKLTVAFDELPAELQTVLRGDQDVHIRWVSTAAYEVVSPLVARLPPGFHLFFTPGEGDAALYANATSGLE